jgi:hypothetical protein
MRITSRFIVPDRPEDGFVTPAKKALPYSITPIGGQAELVAWKKEQELLAEARAVATAKAYAVRREVAVKIVEGQTTTTLSLTDAEKAEMALRPRGEVAAKAPSSPAIEPEPLPEASTPKTLSERLLGAAKRVWDNAFDPQR